MSGGKSRQIYTLSSNTNRPLSNACSHSDNYTLQRTPAQTQEQTGPASGEIICTGALIGEGPSVQRGTISCRKDKREREYISRQVRGERQPREGKPLWDITTFPSARASAVTRRWLAATGSRQHLTTCSRGCLLHNRTLTGCRQWSSGKLLQ